MKTCKDCLHREACNGWLVSEELRVSILSREGCECKQFADRSEWVQVVRCENCKHCTFGDTVYDRYCEELDRNCYGMDFCSFGERMKENEKCNDKH